MTNFLSRILFLGENVELLLGFLVADFRVLEADLMIGDLDDFRLGLLKLGFSFSSFGDSEFDGFELGL